MHINWLIELYIYIRMLGWWVWCLSSWYVCNDYMRCMSVCLSIQFLYDSSIYCPGNNILVLVFLINVPVHWSPFSLILCALISSLFLRLFSSSVSDAECSCSGLFMIGPLLMLVLLLLVPGCFSSWVKILSNGSSLICFCSGSQRYCSVEIFVGFMCCLFWVTYLV